MSITAAQLESHVGKSMADLCSNGFTSTSQNHCAHYVSHALGLRLGLLCGDMAFATRRTGASIRCDEVYNRLEQRGPWAERPRADDGLLIFVLSRRNVVDGVMQNVPQKHVGIHFGGKVFNFSNGQHKVVADPTVEQFHAKFRGLYAGGDIELFYGVAP
ncbi:hypothetical protein [Azohydromonas caseinilytica]|uniref:NlpC/P60 family protein n=1 Tax=Azohydromonas caseinilytica TaxID=2728836 RepID=A0A848F8T0_9BURK|nr:hypothetical protein [Azohydromonas caseinilytica]NML16547.1 hypothetical protein [Azohydromonas caseinilytica]